MHLDIGFNGRAAATQPPEGMQRISLVDSSALAIMPVTAESTRAVSAVALSWLSSVNVFFDTDTDSVMLRVNTLAGWQEFVVYRVPTKAGTLAMWCAACDNPIRPMGAGRDGWGHVNPHKQWSHVAVPTDVGGRIGIQVPHEGQGSRGGNQLRGSTAGRAPVREVDNGFLIINH